MAIRPSTRKEYLAIWRLRKRGWTYNRIASKLGCEAKKVQRAIKWVTENIPTLLPAERLALELERKDDQIREMYRAAEKFYRGWDGRDIKREDIVWDGELVEGVKRETETIKRQVSPSSFLAAHKMIRDLGMDQLELSGAIKAGQQVEVTVTESKRKVDRAKLIESIEHERRNREAKDIE